jgi:hypothetical protein
MQETVKRCSPGKLDNVGSDNWPVMIREVIARLARNPIDKHPTEGIIPNSNVAPVEMKKTGQHRESQNESEGSAGARLIHPVEI